MLTATEEKIDIPAAFREAKCCVVIPTYNNAATLQEVIQNVSRYTQEIIVVNDGSTDGTHAILDALEGVQVVSYSPNQGKGMALRQGFAHAHNQGYQYAITIDSDGQHYPEDLPKFLEKLREEPNAIIIGARNMDQSSVPGKSSFGNKFSNFWFRFETGYNVPDTQSGFRLYPLKPLSNLKFFTRKYEFEIEVMVRAAWRGVNVCSVPVKVYYPPAEERVSHFRPFKDFSRISVLNTVLVTLALLYHIPVRLLRNLQKKNLKKLIVDNILDGDETNAQKACAVGLGMFMGIVPIWGYQIITGIAVAHLLKLNKVLVVLVSNISIPPMMPVILFLSFQTGGWLLGAEAVKFSTDLTWEAVKGNLYQYLLGSICFSVGAGLAAGLFSFILLSLFRRKRLARA